MTTTLRSQFVVLAAVLGLAISVQAQTPQAPPPPVPAHKSILAMARTIYIDSHTQFVKQAELEKSLLKQKEFERWELGLTREQKDADIILEVKRAAFQNNFPYSLIDRRTKMVLAAGEVNSLGGTAHGKIASQVIEKIKAARERAGVK